jgi:hypothetical protein
VTSDQKDFMHGAALVAIADSEHFTALNKSGVKYGHYVINQHRHIFIKYTTGDGPDFWFTFTPDDKSQLAETALHGQVYAVFVCGGEVVTGLTLDELRKLVDLHKPQAESVKVTAEPHKQLRFAGPQGELDHQIARSAFPQRILA